MTVYYKFPRPTEEYMRSINMRAPFEVMFVPSETDPVEKYCYAEIPEELFESFLEDFGGEGELLPDKKEFPDNFEGMVSGRNAKFTIITPRGD